MVPLLAEMIANFCERYYNSESFRRRRPRDWASVPPFFEGTTEEGILFKTDSLISKEVFYNHPTSGYFALFLLYSLLRSANISKDGLNCEIDNLTPEQFDLYESCYHGYFNYADHSKFFHRDCAKPIAHVRFTLTPPAFRMANDRERLANGGKYYYTKTPDNSVIHVCLKDAFWFGSEWCWCLAPAHRIEL